MSTRVQESTVLSTSIDTSWSLVRSLEFDWWKLVDKTERLSGAPGEVGSLKKLYFKDGTAQTIRLVELSDLNYFLSFDLIEANPAAQFTSALHTIGLKRITSNNTTFVEWSVDFSSDAGAAVVQDSQFKRKDGLEDLVQAVSKA